MTTPDYVSQKFEYRPDVGGDRWRILKDIQHSRTVEGDCEDFALTVLWLEAGKSMLNFWWMVLTFQAMIWYVKTDGNVGHAALWVRGKGWTDNIKPYWSRKYQYERVYPMVAPMLALKMFIGKVFK